ncbi:hypothetical protein F4212_10635 [Candidatus Poribacteria bacterium]|nr:hypothetical protein [Candidatus Poribacteria bacterium]
MEWTLFGWAGIQLEIPTTWEISGISGDEKNGYLRLDDADMPRLELKWAKSRKKKPDLHKTLDEYFKLVRKNYKRGGNVSFRRNVDLIKDEDFLKDCTVLGFSWKGGIRANGLIIHNPDTKRITIVQVMGRIKENWRPIVLRVFQSISDKGDPKHTVWSAYGLKLSVPSTYKLEKQKLLSGYLLFTFNRGKYRKISVERYGPAEVLLNEFSSEENQLETWFRTRYAKAIRGYGFEVTPQNENGDERINFVGQQTRLYDTVPFSLVLIVDKILKRTRLTFYTWHCHHTNRIYVVQSIGRHEASEKLAQEVAESIHCH